MIEPSSNQRDISLGDQGDLEAYRGCWVALIGDQVAGVGDSVDAARLAARRSRPRERITAVVFVSEEILP